MLGKLRARHEKQEAPGAQEDRKSHTFAGRKAQCCPTWHEVLLPGSEEVRLSK